MGYFELEMEISSSSVGCTLFVWLAGSVYLSSMCYDVVRLGSERERGSDEMCRGV